MAKRGHDSVQSFLVSDRAELQSRIDLLCDAFALLERTFSKTVEQLCDSGHLDPEAPFLAQWENALQDLRRQGLKSRSLPGEPTGPTVTCPSCNSVLRCAGEYGDRCEWCGHVFTLNCPSCKRTLENVEGKPGDLCLWCHHEF